MNETSVEQSGEKPASKGVDAAAGSVQSAPMFGRTICVGDYVSVRFPFHGSHGTMSGEVTEMQRLKDGRHQGRTPCGWWFSDTDDLLEHRPKHHDEPAGSL